MIAMRNNRRFLPSWSALLLLFLCSFACPSAKGEAGELFESTNLWNAGIDGYQTYRIPGIVVSKRGVIVAYTSARRTLDLGDWSNIDIVLRRSLDGGRTWESSRRIAGDSHGTTDNPVAIVDRRRERCIFYFKKTMPVATTCRARMTVALSRHRSILPRYSTNSVRSTIGT